MQQYHEKHHQSPCHITAAMVATFCPLRLRRGTAGSRQAGVTWPRPRPVPATTRRSRKATHRVRPRDKQDPAPAPVDPSCSGTPPAKPGPAPGDKPARSSTRRSQAAPGLTVQSIRHLSLESGGKKDRRLSFPSRRGQLFISAMRVEWRQRVAQLFDRLDQVFRETGCAAQVHVLIHAIATHRDHLARRGAGGPGQFEFMPRHPVIPGRFDVDRENSRYGRQRAGRRRCRRHKPVTEGGRRRAVSAWVFSQQLEQISGRLLVWGGTGVPAPIVRRRREVR